MGSARGPFFTADEDDEHDSVASFEYMEGGFLPDKGTGKGQSYVLDHPYSPLSPRPVGGGHRSVSIMGPPPIGSPRSGRFYHDTRFEDQRPRFLESCALCKKPLGNHLDIFMYRGDTAFCSEECRQEQIEMDESQEKNRNLSSLRKKDKKSSTKSQDCRLRSGTVAAG
ncbi:hypothetical protein SAY87_020517 [Trapa incisa]|uniref:FLZ-type domain-containing protein n=1 Tax=Trapa incisa TaxID=236973 RepID=A0AAN7JQV7_9MYRT|nr:hypothetical protein SAY87_020517 [Trapa incisa]